MANILGQWQILVWQILVANFAFTKGEPLLLFFRLVAAQRIAQLPEFMFQRCTGPFSFVLLELFRGLFFYAVNFIPYFRGVTV